MAFSYVTRQGDGATRSYTFAFEGQDEGYIREDDILALVDGVSTPFTLLSSNTLEFDSAPPNGSDIIIRRVMPKDLPYADFKRGNNFGQEVLNNSFLQLLYVVHELLDGWFPDGFTVKEAVTFLEGIRSSVSDPDDPDSVVTYAVSEDRYVNTSGDTMQGPLHVNKPVAGTEPARKDGLDAETSARQAADANIQDQLSGEEPLEASAFSPISWHDQTVDSSVVIPENKNAWSFGPSVDIAEGQSVTISEGSYWTIAEGTVVGS